MTKLTKSAFTAALLAATLGLGCSSNGSSSDAGDASSNGSDGGGDTAAPAFNLFSGCYKVTAIDPGAVDGCEDGVDQVVGTWLPVVYDTSDGSVTVGTDGSLGKGPVRDNQATLTRDGTTSFSATCMLHQTDTTLFTLTADYTFTVSVTEMQNMFQSTCSASEVPANGTGMCTSTWTWHMTIDTTKTTPDCK